MADADDFCSRRYGILECFHNLIHAFRRYTEWDFLDHNAIPFPFQFPRMYAGRMLLRGTEYLITLLPVAAPEIVKFEGEYYIFALNQGALDGIRCAKLKWEKK